MAAGRRSVTVCLRPPVAGRWSFSKEFARSTVCARPSILVWIHGNSRVCPELRPRFHSVNGPMTCRPQGDPFNRLIGGDRGRPTRSLASMAPLREKVVPGRRSHTNTSFGVHDRTTVRHNKQRKCHNRHNRRNYRNHRRGRPGGTGSGRSGTPRCRESSWGDSVSCGELAVR